MKGLSRGTATEHRRGREWLLPNLRLEMNLNIGGFLSPPSRRGRCAVQEKWKRYLRNGAARGGQTTPEPKQVFDLPRRAEF